MHELDRVKLLGKYRTPRFKYGDVVTCAIRGKVKIVGLSNGRIPWPKCRSGKLARAIILHGGLADAVRRESAEAVKHWFGVGSFTVWKWRKALEAAAYAQIARAGRQDRGGETVEASAGSRGQDPS